jgi:hypothetical protein
MVAAAAFKACAMSCHPITEHMTEAVQELSPIELRELALSVLYRLSAYAVINLIDDAAMLSIVFI